MSRFLTRAMGRVALSPFAVARPTFPRARLLPQLHASPYSIEAPQSAETAEKGPRIIKPTPPPTKTPEELAQMPYSVRRTDATYLPVYRRARAGQTLIHTLVKRIDGDQKRLAQEMAGALNIDPKDIRVNPTTNHIEIKVRLDAQLLDSAVASAASSSPEELRAICLTR